MTEHMGGADFEPDEQIQLSAETKAMISGYADQLGFTTRDGKFNHRDRFILALKMDEARVDPYQTMEVLAGRGLGPRDSELLMLAYAYKLGKIDRREFFKRFCVDADLLAMIGE